MLLNFPSYLCGLISICAWQACEPTPLTLLEWLDMGTDLSGSILNKLLCCQARFAAICNFLCPLGRKLSWLGVRPQEVECAAVADAPADDGCFTIVWEWWKLPTLSASCAINHLLLWLLLNVVQYCCGVSKKHFTTRGKTIKARVGYMLKFGGTWPTRGLWGKQA